MSAGVCGKHFRSSSSHSLFSFQDRAFFSYSLMEGNAVCIKIQCEAFFFTQNTISVDDCCAMSCHLSTFFLNYKFGDGKYILQKKIIYQKVELFRTMRAMWFVVHNTEIGQKSLFQRSEVWTVYFKAVGLNRILFDLFF